MPRTLAPLLSLALSASIGAAEPVQRDVTFQSEGVSLAGTLYLPEGLTEPIGAIVLGHGSAPTTRESNQFYIHNALELGFAAFAYDKHGRRLIGVQKSDSNPKKPASIEVRLLSNRGFVLHHASTLIRWVTCRRRRDLHQ
ncbi:MAG: poly(3-hydroxybutyrate) depolymerase [Phycisphaerales bacterium]|jgi:poly(3-hydroxybutyrate) depolymerase